MNVNELILLYVVGTITRERLENSLREIGFSEQIISIHMAKADYELAQLCVADNSQEPLRCNGGETGA